MTESILQKKSFSFSLEIISVYKQLVQEKEFVLSKQLLRSGTSIGANAAEANFGQSYKDFIHKLQISRKEANESLYWINLLYAADYITAEVHSRLIESCTEILKILTASIITVEKKLGISKRI